MTGEMLASYAKVCSENKIAQLKLPCGTYIVMHDFAFYEKNLAVPNAGQADFPTINELDNDTIYDEDTLFMSAR